MDAPPRPNTVLPELASVAAAKVTKPRMPFIR